MSKWVVFLRDMDRVKTVLLEAANVKSESTHYDFRNVHDHVLARFHKDSVAGYFEGETEKVDYAVKRSE